MLFGLLLRERLPEFIVIHWGLSGQPDGWAGAEVAIFLLPVLLLAFHWVCMLITFWDNAKREQNEKVMALVFWIMPATSLFANSLVYLTAFGFEPDFRLVLGGTMAALFLVIGNYLPKCKQSRTMGIKLSWTLANKENWNATHRFGGKVWMICGMLALFAMLLPEKVFFVALPVLILPAAVLPVIYSYAFYKKQLKEGNATCEEYRAGGLNKKGKVVSIVAVALVLVACAVLMFMGEFTVETSEEGIRVDATMWSDLELNYADIDAVEYRETDPMGQRVNGWGSAKLLMGYFKSEELGKHIRYSYTDKANGCVILRCDDTTYVIGCADRETTRGLYETILAHVEGED